jgi:uncharacterized membrane protein YkvA (DUF1232 family)
MRNLKTWANGLKNNIFALYLASRDIRVPLIAKVFIGLILTYALSPIDLIPDFIPVVGYLDDLILLPLGIYFVVQLIPRYIWIECQEKAKYQEFDLPKNKFAAVCIISIWLVIIAVLINLHF